MALKQAEQVKFESVNKMVDILHSMNQTGPEIKEKVADMVTELETSANIKLELVYNEGAPSFEIIDLKSDFVRTRATTDDKMLSLKAKIFSVPIDVKIFKEADGLNLSNSSVAKSLRELADIVDGMDKEMVAVGKFDWPRTPGEAPVLEDEGELVTESLGDNIDSSLEASNAVEEAEEAPVEVESESEELTTEMPADMTKNPLVG